MRAAAAFATLVLAAVGAVGAHGSARVACPPAAQAREDGGRGFELDVFGAAGYVSDAQGLVADDIPGINDDSFLINSPPDQIHQLVIAPGHTDSYTATMVASKPWPVIVRLSHRFEDAKGYLVASDIASWFLPRELNGTPISVSFASGQALRDVRLCVNGSAVAPTGTASGAAARDEGPPFISPSVAPAGSGRMRVTLRARDPQSGIAGIWYLLLPPGVRRATPYRAPVVVKRGTIVIYWAVDRAGNTTNYEVRAR